MLDLDQINHHEMIKSHNITCANQRVYTSRCENVPIDLGMTPEAKVINTFFLSVHGKDGTG